MAQAAVVGRPGAGKTLFVLRFAQWCGSRRVVLTTRPAAGGLRVRWEMEPAEAVAELVGSSPPTTRRLQSLEVVHKRGKHPARVELVDTVGLTDEAHPDPDLRRGMADTLAVVLASRVLLHVIDGPQLASRPDRLLDEADVDAQLGSFGSRRPGYAVLVNKLDLPGGREGLAAARRAWPKQVVIGISALEGWGFDGVRRFLRHALR